MLKGKFIRFGIPEPRGRETDDDLKGGDRIGLEQVFITPDMVGKTVAVFKNIEIKGYGDKPKRGQELWHNLILSLGGLSEFWLEQKDGGIKIINEPIIQENRDMETAEHSRHEATCKQDSSAN